MFFRQSSSVAPSSPPPVAGAEPVAPAQPTPGSSQAAGSAPSRALVLVVEDSGMIRAAVTKTLASGNYEVMTATNGREGLETWDKNQARIALVLSDVFMPEMDGLTMTREIRRRHRTVPVIIMSSKLDDDSRWIAEEAGFRLLAKPFKDALLLELIARMLRLRAST